MQIPWLFPDFSQYSFFSWPSTKFPDFSLTFAKSGISLTFPWPLDTLSKVPFEISHKRLNLYTTKYAFYDVLKIWLIVVS